MDLPRKKQIIAWCFYDFANSSYSAVIAAVVFPVYFVSFIVGNQTGIGDLWWGRAISLSMLFVVITSPFLGGISDYTGKTRSFLSIYTLICVLAVFLLITVEKGEILKGVIIIIVANSAMEGGFVFIMHISGKSVQRNILEGSHHGALVWDIWAQSYPC